MSVVSFNNIQVKFDEKLVFKDFSENIEKGEKIVLSGESGSGKTTLMNCILGFVPLTKESITVNGKEVNPDNITEIRKETSWLPQELSFGMQTCREHLYFPFQFAHNKNIRPANEEVHAILKELLLPADILQRNINEISGGQKQRLSLASVLLLHRPLLLLDEPTSALDGKAVQAVLQLIHKKKDITVISTSHDPEWVKGMSRIIKIKQL